MRSFERLLVAAFRRVCAAAVFLFLASFSSGAMAYFGAPTIVPSNPVAGDRISVHLSVGICDGTISHEGYPQLIREGHNIHLVEWGFHFEEGDAQCIFPPGSLDEPIGQYPQGDYLVTVDFRYPDSVFGPQTLNIGVVPFTVTGGPQPTSLPALAPFSALSLLGLIVGFASRFIPAKKR